MIKKDIYDKLADHLGQGSLFALPKTKELFEMLEMLFSPEQAEFALTLPLVGTGKIMVEDLAKEMNRALEEVHEVVETMARAGTVKAVRKREDGKTYYALFPLVPGIMESTYADRIDNDQKRKLGDLWDKYCTESFVPQNTRSNYPLLRIIPINRNIDPTSQVLPFEEVTTRLQDAETFTVIPCHCRSAARRCDHLLEAEIVYGDWAEYLIEYRGNRRWTKEEVLKRLEECEEDGLVHLGGNTQKGAKTGLICACCPCCCGALRAIVEFQNTRSIARSNFAPNVDQEACALCLSCVEICPTKAMGEVANGSDTKIMSQESLCIGCGLCSTHCPENAISMVKVRDFLPAATGMEMVQRYFKEMIS